MQTIRRGTTPTIHFTTTITQTDVSAIYLTFVQAGNIVLEKTIADVLWDATGLYVVLSQAETLSLNAGMASVQIRAKLNNSEATATQVLQLYVDTVLKDGVI